MTPDYADFQAEDFVLDASFQAYVTNTDGAAVQFWQNWLAQHPAQQPAAEQARQLVQGLSRARQPAVATHQKEQDVQRLLQSIRPAVAAPRLRVQRLRRIRLVVGVLGLLALSTGYALWPFPPLGATRYATLTGQQQTVRLPDGSVVVLNGNSQLTTAGHWDAQHTREVWLEGEAYFQVSHLAVVPDLPISRATGNAKFVVHAGDLTVAVLGTKFNVINRPGVLDKVTLNEGKVQVVHTKLLSQDQILMKPGELVEYAPTQHELTKRQVQPAYYSAWVRGTLEFNRTPLREIIALLRDTYGLYVSVDDPALLGQTITGSVDDTNADVLLNALASSFGVSSERQGNKVRFRAIK